MRKAFLALMATLALTGFVVAEDVVERPFVLADTQVIPEYPPAALAAGFDGAVGVAAMVNSDGSIGTVQVIEKSAAGKLGFEEAALAAMKQWKFSPARVNGEAVDSVYAYVFYFGDGERGGRGGGNVFGQFVTTEIAGVGDSIGIGETPTDPGPKPGLSKGNLPAIETALSALVKYGKPPACQGCLYDRRDLIPPKMSGYDGPNRPR